MKLVSVRVGNQRELGVATDEGIVAIDSMSVKGTDGKKMTLNRLMRSPYLLDAIDEALCENAGSLDVLENGSISFEPAIGRPEKIICLGHNYREHVKELGNELPEYPILFSKFNNAIAASNEDVPLPKCSSMIDYEGELGIMIGKEAEDVSQEDALDYVFGYFIGNDVSARDLQFKTQQWLIGKTCDKFYPTGPYLVTSDEVPDPQNLSLKTTVNGEIRQNSNTSDMIFPCSEIVSYASSIMKLKPGDVISTGTPQGVVAGMPEGKKKWLKNGDVVEIEIQGLGKLTNRFVQN